LIGCIKMLYNVPKDFYFVPQFIFSDHPGGIGLGPFVAGLVVSNPAGGMNVCLLCLYVLLPCVARGLCD
jgi:hypothetical protein